MIVNHCNLNLHCDNVDPQYDDVNTHWGNENTPA